MGGLSYPGTPSSPKEWSSSLHEVGHVLLAIACDQPIYSVEIARGGGSGFFLSHPDAGERPWSEVCGAVRKIEPPLSWVIDHLAGYYAGGLAQMHFLHDELDLQTSCGADFEDANCLLDTFCVNEDQQAFLRSQALDKATKTISKYSAIAWEIALRLYTWRKLYREQILEAVRDAPGGRELLAGTTRYCARDNVRPGHEGLMQRSASSISDLRHRALHESSHAVAAHALRIPVVDVTARTDKAETRVKFGRHPGALVVLMVGEAIEEVLGFSGGSPGDREIAMGLAHGDQEKVNQALVKARAFVRDHMGEIEKLAVALESRGVLSGAAVSNILAAAPEPRPVMSAERRRQIAVAVATRELADEGFEPTASNITWWVREILNGQAACT